MDRERSFIFQVLEKDLKSFQFLYLIKTFHRRIGKRKILYLFHNDARSQLVNWSDRSQRATRLLTPRRSFSTSLGEERMGETRGKKARRRRRRRGREKRRGKRNKRQTSENFVPKYEPGNCSFAEAAAYGRVVRTRTNAIHLA